MPGRGSVCAALAALALLAGACGGQSTLPTTTTTTPTTTTTGPTTIATTTTAASAPTTTTSTLPATTTTTSPTTTTTLPPPLPVVGWEGPGLRSLAVEVAFEYDPPAGLRDLVVSALEAMGLEVDGAAGAVLALDLAGTPRSGEYGELGTCYTGAQVRGTLSLTAPDRPPLRFDLDGERAVAAGVLGRNCRRNPGEAPFDWAFEPEFMDAVVAIWGPASVPYLTTILHDDLYLIRLRLEAIAAYRLMDPAAIPPQQQYEFMSAAVWFIERSLHMSDDGEIATYREGVRRLLLAYSETDYGFEDQADIWEWEAWLASWLAQQ